jgi:hypothetical protein
MIVACAIALPVLGFAVGVWYGQRRCREEFAEQYRVAIAAQRLREYHRFNAEHKAYRKIDLKKHPVFEGETMKVSLN